MNGGFDISFQQTKGGTTRPSSNAGNHCDNVIRANVVVLCVRQNSIYWTKLRQLAPVWDSSMDRGFIATTHMEVHQVQTVSTNNELLRPREAADWLKISERTLWSLTQRGELPAVRIGRSVQYDLADLIEFVAASKVGVPA